MNVNLSTVFEQYISDQVGTGKYNNASEVVREALRLKMQNEELYTAKLEALRGDVGIACQQIARGEAVDFDPEEMLARVKGKAKDGV